MSQAVETPRFNLYSPELFAAFDQYSPQILTKLNEFRTHYLAQRNKTARGIGLFDPYKRALQEMPLCQSSSKISDLFPHKMGIFPIHGSITATGDLWREGEDLTRKDHVFLLIPKEDIIIDFTVAQFVQYYNDDLRAGQRMRLLMDTAPQFTRAGRFGLVSFVGPRRAIEKAIGLTYIEP